MVTAATDSLTDLDYFKEINDRFDHHIGDLALTGFADVCRDVLQQSNQTPSKSIQTK